MKKVFVLFLMVILVFSAFAAEKVNFEQPIMITSGGQSPGALQMKVLAKSAKLDYAFEKTISADEFGAGNFKTLIIVIGASGKGLGAAGIDIDAEVARVEGLAAFAKENGIKVALFQLEGAARRGTSTDLIIDVLAPYADAVFFKADGNEDGKFTQLESDYPVFFESFEKTSDVKGILTSNFSN